MTIRTKVWLLVATSVAVISGATQVLRTYAFRRELIEQSKDAAVAVAKEIADALVALDANAVDADLANVLTTYGLRYSRIQRSELHVEREDQGSTLSIVAPRGDQLEIRRLGPAIRLPEHNFSRTDTGVNSYEVREDVDLQGPYKATLRLQWSLVGVETVLAKSERGWLTMALVELVGLVLLVGFIIDRAVVARLDTLGRAMRDVEGGNLARRVYTADSHDEVARLSQGFNRMLDRLSAADTEIRAFNQRLANEIEAATQDLSTKNVALGQLNRLLDDLRRENASRVRLATLGQLAAQLAHEIGTPLSSVSGHLQLALLQRELPAGLRDRLDVAVREIARIGRIVRDYLDSTRSMEPERKPSSLAQILTEAVEITGGLERSVRARIDLVVPPDPPGFVTDPGLLRQIIINLLTNGLDAVDQGGRVRIEARMESRMGHATAAEQVVITVTDTGSGIPADDLRRIFEPFYTTKGRGKGTGLGLAICRELIAALSGTIDVQSAPGKGSAFTVRLPLRGAAPGGEARATAAGAAATAGGGA
jgi:signal transduction histidine kinase